MQMFCVKIARLITKQKKQVKVGSNGRLAARAKFISIAAGVWWIFFQKWPQRVIVGVSPFVLSGNYATHSSPRGLR